MAVFQVFTCPPESFTALTDFKFWATVLEERACVRDWTKTKALTWVQKLQTRLDMAKDYPGIALAFFPFLEGVAKQTSDAKTDVSLCLDAATIFRKFSECPEEKEIIGILRDTLKKTRKVYIQTYRQTEVKRQIYKECLMCLKSLIGSKEIVTQLALRVKAKDVGSHFMKALEREQELRTNLNTVSEKYKSATKQEAIRKLQYFLNTWRKRFLGHIAHTFFSTQNKCNPYLETYKKLFKICAEDAVEVIFDCNKGRTDILGTHISTDVGIDVKTLLGFEEKTSSLAPKVKNEVSYADLSTFIKRQVYVVLGYTARGKHELNIKKVLRSCHE
ncbi:hypothetical protein CHS0354_031450, partial [Potamilus streckersoni]